MVDLFSVYHWWYARKRLAALNVDIIKDDGENYIFLAQRDMLELEIEWHRGAAKVLLFVLCGVTAIFGGILYIYFDVIHMFESDISANVFEHFSNIKLKEYFHGFKG